MAVIPKEPPPPVEEPFEPPEPELFDEPPPKPKGVGRKRSPEEIEKIARSEAEASERARLAGEKPPVVFPGHPLFGVKEKPPTKPPLAKPKEKPPTKKPTPMLHLPPVTPVEDKKVAPPPKAKIAKLAPRATAVIVKERMKKQMMALMSPEALKAELKRTSTEATAQRFGKSFVPGWLTIEDWKHMTPLEQGCSIAGDVGQTAALPCHHQ